MRNLLFILFLLPSLLIGQNPLFDEISDQAGTGNGINNNGIIIGDFNGDGYEDLFIPSRLDKNRLFKNNGDGTFKDVTAESGIETDGLTMTGAWGDIDGDGDLDLFIGNYYTPTAPYSNYLYLNDGNGVFEDISVSAGVAANSQTRSIHMIDLNLDGMLDIYVCNLLQENTTWQNNGDNTFSNTTFAYGLGDRQLSMGAIFFDYDNDGDQDAYLTHDGNQANIMYENNGQGRYVDVSASTGLDMVGQGMGVDHGDINNDGHLDIYVTNLGANFLMLNDGTGRYTEIAIEAGAADQSGMGWGCFFLDYDNDGWEDIYVVNDSQFSTATNKLYKNNGDLTFTLVSENHSLSSPFAGRAGTWADLNNDGYPEILVANNQQSIGVQIFKNSNTENNWIAFELVGTSVTADAFGTRISLTTDLGVKIDEKTGGSSYASQSSHRVHFGLGQGEASDITITWPDGSVDFFAQLDINQLHTITQGMSLSDADGDSYNSDTDCDDTNPNVNPGVVEIPYNGLDDDCDSLTPDDDLDQDGFVLAEDCDDDNPQINPNLLETPYNGLDDDCDPMTLDDDLDQDGFGFAEDCNDNNPQINPNLLETPYNGLDDDCDPMTLDDDLDQDGFVLAEDCNDTNAMINPGLGEITYNGQDDDCNPLTLDDDLDSDGFLLTEDCDDTNAMINPNVLEIPNNGVDDNCDGIVDETSAIANTILPNTLKIYPNPAQDYLYLDSDELIRGVEIFNLQGQFIQDCTLNCNYLNLKDLSPAIYMIKVLIGSKMYVTSVVKI